MNKLVRRLWSGLVAAGLLAAGVSATPVAAEEKLRPYVLASNEPGTIPEAVTRVKDALSANGFEVVGEYAPYDGAYVIVVTNSALKRTAAKSEMGGFGAVQRVAVTAWNDRVQVAYTNPRYMAHAYRMATDLSDVAGQLEKALGAQDTFGAEGRSPGELRQYHYKMFMPYFDEPWVLKEFSSHRAALREIEQNLAKGVGGASKVYRVDLPGKNETLIGVGLTEGCGGDEFIMKTINSEPPLKSTPHLPYEILVTDGKVRALHAKFRIAQSFPDLKMIGSNSFWDIKCAPDAIQQALTKVVGGQTEAKNW